MNTTLATQLTGHADRCFEEPTLMDLETAHRVSQQQAHYPNSPCLWRRAALEVLIRNKHLKPDHARLAQWAC